MKSVLSDYRWRHRLAGAALGLLALPAFALDTTPGTLPELVIDLSQTTVSGISSGAFMAVQMGVAHSASVKGVAATAGGPYFCALQDSLGGSGVNQAIKRCMQGDPSYGMTPITSRDMDRMKDYTRTWGEKGLIDPVSNLANQAVWVFHGYNDGIVKAPVSNALIDWYQGFTPASQVFHKDVLKAGHAQISSSCTAGDTSCNPCAQTGNKFINACQDQPASSSALYDAAGAALEMFYGPLADRTDTGALQGKLYSFEQKDYIRKRDGTSLVDPIKISMGKTGYVYVPQSCQAGEPCRLHIAFHGCMQSATSVGESFVRGAGFNEWAEANRMVVLYPQTTTSIPNILGSQPLNPMGCWDWWGYNDQMYDPYPGGYYAQKRGVQIAAVWRMAEKLAAKGTPGQGVAAALAPVLRVSDHSATQAVLSWTPVAGAAQYRVLRATGSDAPVQVAELPASRSFYVDGGLSPSTGYRYSVKALANGAEVGVYGEVPVQTAPAAPACDPYYSLAKNQPVTKDGKPTTVTCP